MYEAFYEFTSTPFTRGIPPHALFANEELDEILMRLTYVAERQLFAVVTGDCGTGKTTLLRRFQDSLDSRRYKFLYVSDSKLTPRNFYRALLEQLGFEASYYRGEAKRQLHREIEIMKGVHNIHPICVCDECHLMNREMLEEIRFLLNVKLDSVSPMGLILVGQSELWEKLQLQSHAAIRQRIDVQCKLNHFDRAGTGSYIRHQIKAAGCEREIFTDAAMDEVFKYSNGSARLINKACTSSLMYGSQSKKRILDDHALKLIIECELS